MSMTARRLHVLSSNVSAVCVCVQVRPLTVSSSSSSSIYVTCLWSRCGTWLQQSHCASSVDARSLDTNENGCPSLARACDVMWCMSSSRAADVILMTWFMKTVHWLSWRDRSRETEVSPAKTQRAITGLYSLELARTRTVSLEREREREAACTAVTSESAVVSRGLSPAGYWFYMPLHCIINDMITYNITLLHLLLNSISLKTQ